MGGAAGRFTREHTERKGNPEPTDPFDTDRRTFRGYQGERRVPEVQLPLGRKGLQGVHAVCIRPEHK